MAVWLHGIISTVTQDLDEETCADRQRHVTLDGIPQRRFTCAAQQASTRVSSRCTVALRNYANESDVKSEWQVDAAATNVAMHDCR